MHAELTPLYLCQQPVGFCLRLDGQQFCAALGGLCTGLFQRQPGLEYQFIGMGGAVLGEACVPFDPRIARVFPGLDIPHPEKSQGLGCRPIGIGRQPGDGIIGHVVDGALVGGIPVPGNGVLIDFHTVRDGFAIRAGDDMALCIQRLEGKPAAIAFGAIPAQARKILRPDDVVSVLLAQHRALAVLALQIQGRVRAVLYGLPLRVRNLHLGDAQGGGRMALGAAGERRRVLLANGQGFLEGHAQGVDVLRVDRWG